MPCDIDRIYMIIGIGYDVFSTALFGRGNLLSFL